MIFSTLAIASLSLGISWGEVTDPQPAEAPWDYAVILSSTEAYLLDLVTLDTIDLPMPNHPVDNPGYTITAWGGIFKAGGTGSKKVEMFDPDLGTWTDWTDLTQVRTHPAVAYTNDTLYVFGGEEDTIQTGYCWYSVGGGSWTLFHSPKTYKHGSGVYAKQYYWAEIGRVAIPLIDGRIVLAGGQGETMPSDRVDIYNPATNTWATSPTMPEGIAYGILVGGTVVYNPDNGIFWGLSQ